ncbi:MAG: hypothetical protein CMJ64_17200 [Planctomycetaceae bacterium]|nr:hypothetical protein [Planctomycetaceae bacterium]
MATSLLGSTLPEPPFYRITVDQLHQMLTTGVIDDGEPVELIEGLLVKKDRGDAGGEAMVHGPRHAKAVRRLSRLGLQLQASGFDIQVQLPITLSATSAPEPDAAVVVRDADDYQDRHPSPSDIAVVFEVSDTSLPYDRDIKKRLYAGPEYPCIAFSTCGITSLKSAEVRMQKLASI